MRIGYSRVFEGAFETATAKEAPSSPACIHHIAPRPSGSRLLLDVHVLQSLLNLSGLSKHTCRLHWKLAPPAHLRGRSPLASWSACMSDWPVPLSVGHAPVTSELVQVLSILHRVETACVPKRNILQVCPPAES